MYNIIKKTGHLGRFFSFIRFFLKKRRNNKAYQEFKLWHNKHRGA